ncbi:MAG: IPT/TIG domain-containing protein [Acidobacteria bacterium]|nr:IPT/TIG domain-containing protein [Acidobacteriota bacterium]
MAHSLVRRALVALAVCAFGLSAGCSDDSPGITTPPPPTPFRVLSVSPSSGPAGVATAIRVVGTSFQSGATLTLDGAAVPATFESSTVLTAVAPAHQSGPVDVVVTNPDGATSRLTRGFTYVSQITSLLLTGNTTLTSIGETTQLTATATFSDGVTRDVSSEARWSTSIASAATVSAAGLVTARSLGSSVIGTGFPFSGSPSMFRSVTVTITPPGTFTSRGRAREPGAGSLTAVRVLHLHTGQTASTDVNGYYSVGGLTGAPRFSFVKADFENVEIDVAPDRATDIPMQRVIRVAAGGAPFTSRLAPNDMNYLVTSGTHCQPCRIIRITSETPGTVQVKLTWADPSVVLNVWANGRIVPGDADLREVIAELTLGRGEDFVFVGRSNPGLIEYQHYLPFTVSVIRPGQ